MLYKLFSTEENAVDYYWRFWGTHMHEPLPSYVYGNITDSSPVVGECFFLCVCGLADRPFLFLSV